MQETKDDKTGETSKESNDDGNADATSNKTLNEIEESEKVSTEPNGEEHSAPPSPDGAVDSELNERTPKDDIGPM